MARAFTIYFPFNGSTYTAVITETGGSTTIYIPDETLHSLLPEGKISFDPQEGVPIDKPELQPAQSLIVNILGAIEAKYYGVKPGDKDFSS